MPKGRMPERWRSSPPISALQARKLSVEGIISCVKRVAVIDMGSNSWRLVVFGYEPDTVWWSLVDEIREAVRVGAGMGVCGPVRCKA